MDVVGTYSTSGSGFEWASKSMGGLQLGEKIEKFKHASMYNTTYSFTYSLNF